MDYEEFIRGTMVALKGIDSPAMLVLESNDVDTHCAWFDKNWTLCSEHFGNDLLVEAEHH